MTATLESLPLTAQHIIPAQDYDSWSDAMAGLGEYGHKVSIAKVNTLAGECGIEQAVLRQSHFGNLTMLDWKWDDIPQTMKRWGKLATLAGASIMTVRASASKQGLDAVRDGVDEALEIRPYLSRPWLVGVTVLTSMEETVCYSIFGDSRNKKVSQFTNMAADAGYDGVVCAARENWLVKSDVNTQHLKVFTAAVKPDFDTDPSDQINSVSPRVAAQEGADFYIVGRGIIRSRRFGLSGNEAIDYIVEDIEAA